MPRANESMTDRVIRVALGLILLLLAWLAFDGVLAWVALIVGVIALFTGVAGFCAIYRILGITTTKS